MPRWWTAWRATTTPAVSGGASLTAVAGTGASDVWGVGFTGSQGWGGTLAMRWNGKAWKRLATPAGLTLNAVAATGTRDVWAVGGTDKGTLVLHGAGAAFRAVPSPQPPAPSGQRPMLNAVAATGPRDAWAAGCSSTDDATKNTAFLQHWNGTAWSLVPLPPVSGATDTCLNGITATAPKDIWAVGRAAGANHGAPLVLHGDGTRWSVVPTPTLQQADAHLTGVAVGPDHQIWLAGFSKKTFGDPVQATALLEHGDGTHWQATTPPAGNAWIYGLTAGRNGVFASGYTSSTPLLLSWTGTAWQPQTVPGKPDNLMGLGTVPGTGATWVVGATGADHPQALAAVRG